MAKKTGVLTVDSLDSPVHTTHDHRCRPSKILLTTPTFGQPCATQLDTAKKSALHHQEPLVWFHFGVALLLTNVNNFPKTSSTQIIRTLALRLLSIECAIKLIINGHLGLLREESITSTQASFFPFPSYLGYQCSSIFSAISSGQ